MASKPMMRSIPTRVAVATVLCVALVALMPTPAGASPARFSSTAVAINNHGVIVGEVHVPDSARCTEDSSNVCVHPAVFRANGIWDLGTLGGPSARLTAVNDNGLAAGVSDMAATDPDTGQPVSRAMTADTTTGRLRALGTLGGTNSDAQGIDSLGDVVGFAQTASGDYHAFIAPAGGQLRDLGTLRGGNFSTATAVSRNGQYVVGYSNTKSGATHAVEWSGTSVRDLGTLSGGFSAAWGVNSSGVVVGLASLRNGDEVGVVWNNGATQRVGDLGGGFSWAKAINEADVIVGFSVKPDGSGVGFRASPWSNQLQQISALTGFFTTAQGENDRGQAVGDADRGSNDPHGQPGFDAMLFDNTGRNVDLATL